MVVVVVLLAFFFIDGLTGSFLSMYYFLCSFLGVDMQLSTRGHLHSHLHSQQHKRKNVLGDQYHWDVPEQSWAVAVNNQNNQLLLSMLSSGEEGTPGHLVEEVVAEVEGEVGIVVGHNECWLPRQKKNCSLVKLLLALSSQED